MQEIDNYCLCALHEMKPLSEKLMRQAMPTGSVWDDVVFCPQSGVLQKLVLTVQTCSTFPRSDAVKSTVRSIEIGDR